MDVGPLPPCSLFLRGVPILVWKENTTEEKRARRAHLTLEAEKVAHVARNITVCITEIPGKVRLSLPLYVAIGGLLDLNALRNRIRFNIASQIRCNHLGNQPNRRKLSAHEQQSE